MKKALYAAEPRIVCTLLFMGWLLSACSTTPAAPTVSLKSRAALLETNGIATSAVIVEALQPRQTPVGQLIIGPFETVSVNGGAPLATERCAWLVLIEPIQNVPLEGSMILEFSVGQDGVPTDSTATSSNLPQEFVASVEQVVGKWRFRPYRYAEGFVTYRCRMKMEYVAG